MTETEEMEELFERLPWLREQFEIEREILEQQASVEIVYKLVLRRIEWAEYLD